MLLRVFLVGIPLFADTWRPADLGPRDAHDRRRQRARDRADRREAHARVLVDLARGLRPHRRGRGRVHDRRGRRTRAAVGVPLPARVLVHDDRRVHGRDGGRPLEPRCPSLDRRLQAARHEAARPRRAARVLPARAGRGAAHGRVRRQARGLRGGHRRARVLPRDRRRPRRGRRLVHVPAHRRGDVLDRGRPRVGEAGAGPGRPRRRRGADDHRRRSPSRSASRPAGSCTSPATPRSRRWSSSSTSSLRPRAGAGTSAGPPSPRPRAPPPCAGRARRAPVPRGGAPRR